MDCRLQSLWNLCSYSWVISDQVNWCLVLKKALNRLFSDRLHEETILVGELLLTLIRTLWPQKKMARLFSLPESTASLDIIFTDVGHFSY
jgi:hypothetical protein